MWKLLIAFIAFAALAVWVLTKAGDKVDLGGEKHGAEAVQAPAAPASGASAP